MGYHWSALAEASGGQWTLDRNKTRLGLSPTNRTRYTINELETQFDNLCDGNFTFDFSLQEITERYWASLEAHKSWDPGFELLKNKPTDLKLPIIPATEDIVIPQLDFYALDPNMDCFLLSPRKLYSLNLDEQTELTDRQLFLLRNDSTMNGKYFAPDNLLTPPPCNVKSLLQSWDSTNQSGTFDYPTAVLKYYADTLTRPTPYYDYSFVEDNLDDWTL